MNPEDNNKQTKHTVQDTGNEKETQVQEREVESPSTEAVANFAKQMAEFSYAIKNSLNDEKRAEVNAAVQKAFDSDFDFEQTKAALEEARLCLAGHEDILRIYDVAFSSFDESKAEYMRRVNRLMMQNKA